MQISFLLGRLIRQSDEEHRLQMMALSGRDYPVGVRYRELKKMLAECGVFVMENRIKSFL